MCVLKLLEHTIINSIDMSIWEYLGRLIISGNNQSTVKRNFKNLVDEKCVQCGLLPTDNLSIQMDHISGDNTDNHLFNLRFLCPNCHAKTNTYAGRNKGKYKNKYKE